LAQQFSIWQNLVCVNLLPAQTVSTTPIVSPYIYLGNCHKAFIEVEVNQGNATQTVLITPLQATSLAGANSKALSGPAPIASIDDTSVATGTDQFTFSTGVSFTTSLTVKNKSVIFALTPSEHLDVNNITLPAGTSFNHLGVSIVAAGTTAPLSIITARLKFMPRETRQTPPTTYL
jgi:hypothetical protein